MSRDHVGAPSDAHKEQHNTGIPNKLGPEDMAQNEEMTEKYTEDDTDVKEKIRTNHPNRNERMDNGNI